MGLDVTCVFSTFCSELLHKDATRRLGTKMGAAEVKAHRWLRNIKCATYIVMVHIQAHPTPNQYSLL